MTRSPDEYIVARRTLLDALDVLSEHTEAMVLVGAQAVYQRTGDVPGTGIPMTTDSDLAIDADLLADAPEMSGLLTDAGFSAASQPGHWISSHGIGLDPVLCQKRAGHEQGRKRGGEFPKGSHLGLRSAMNLPCP